MCQNTTLWVYGAWIRKYYALCSKPYSAFAMCHNPAPVRDKPPGAPAPVKPVYFCNSTKFQWQPVYLNLCAPPSGVAHVDVVYSLLWLPWAPPLCHHIILTAHWRTGRKSWLDTDTWVGWDLSTVALEVVKKTSFNYYDKGVTPTSFPSYCYHLRFEV